MPLGQRAGDNSESRYCGAEVAHVEDIQFTLSSSLSAGFDFIVTPLTNPDYRTENAVIDAVPPFLGSDLILSPSQWSSHVVGKLSDWIDLDSSEDVLRLHSEAALTREISWASHLSIQACLLPAPRPLDCANYARCVNQTLQGLNSMQLWLRIPLQTPEMECAEANGTEDAVYLERDPVSNRFLNDSWEWWHVFRMLCEHHGHLSVALDITASLPSENAVNRWLGEPLKAAILHTDAFLTNKSGYPCLPKQHQKLVTTLLNHSVQIILTGDQLHQNKDVALLSEDLDHPLKLYRDYLVNLYRRLDPLTVQEQYELGYRDFLQAPLQPLMDNLEAQTYETFEKDATKYSQYQRAIRAALLDRVSDSEASTSVIVLMVVGAGRGPLVKASLEAAKESGRMLRVYAVEKNPNAVVTLSRLIEMEGWKGTVTLVSCDMRSWNAPEQADILVSELLGSFGDNELSPECLDGAQRFLKEDGISIPTSYTSYIGPIAASKVYNDVKTYGDIAHFETAYVVKLHNAVRLAAPQPVFTFHHPNAGKTDNRRYKKLSFELPADTGSAVVHGFGGYFDAVLYKDIHLGIEPSSATPNMFSWFAIFFPLRTPVYLSAGALLEAQFWRCVGPAKVWYEWCVTVPTVSPIQNPNGRSYWVGL